MRTHTSNTTGARRPLHAPLPALAERVGGGERAAGLQHWFPLAVELEPRVGGRIAFRTTNLPEETSGTSSPTTAAGRWPFTWGGDELHLTVEPT
jgi:hypothetical protein